MEILKYGRKSIIRIYGWRLSTMYRNSPYSSKIRNEKTGEITTRMVSVIEQVAELPTIYKPVDAIDESKQTQIRRAMLCALCHTMPGTGFHSDT